MGAAQVSGPFASLTKIDALFDMGWHQFDQGYREAALETFQILLVLRQQMADLRGVEVALNCIGFIYDCGDDEQGDSLQAGSLSDKLDSDELDGNLAPVALDAEARDEAGDLDRVMHANHLSTRGTLHYRAGHLKAAVDCYEAALKAFHHAQNLIGVGKTLSDLGMAYNQLGQGERAYGLCQAAVGILESSGDQVYYATALHSLGVTQYALGRYEAAVVVLSQALDLRTQLGDRSGESMTLSYLGRAYEQLNQNMFALCCYESALDICRMITQPSFVERQGEARILGQLASLYQRTGHPDLAVEHALAALDILTAIADQRGAIRILYNLGQFHETLGRTTIALHYYQQAIDRLKNVKPDRIDVTTLWDFIIDPLTPTRHRSSDSAA